MDELLCECLHPRRYHQTPFGFGVALRCHVETGISNGEHGQVCKCKKFQPSSDEPSLSEEITETADPPAILFSDEADLVESMVAAD